MVAAVLCACAVGCSRGGKSSGTEAAAPTAKSVKAGPRYVVVNNLAEPEYLDPGMMTGVVESNISNALFEGLMQMDAKDAHAVPGVAERWEITEDGKVYTFFLRTNAKWSDGQPVTAHDFVYAWERVLNPKTGAPYAYILYFLKNAEAYNAGKLADPKQLGFVAIDDHTLKVTLKNPAPFFIELLTHSTYYPVPKWAVEAHGARWTRVGNIVSNGPFMLKKWVPHEEILAVKNPHYWDAVVVKALGIRFLPVEEKETALKMYEAGEIDIDWELPVMKIPSLMHRPDFVQHPFLASYFYRVNTTRKPFTDVRVRQALSMAIDRTTLTDQYMKKTEIASDRLVPPGMAGYERAAGLGFDPAKARQLLAEAGYPDPSKFPSFAIHYNTDDRHKLVAQVIQQMWKEHLGIRVTLHNEEWKSYLKTQRLLGYDVTRSGWTADYPDPDNFLSLFTSYSTLSNTGWKNAAYDKAVEASMQVTDWEKRFFHLKQAEAIILREAPILPIYTYKKMMLVRPYVKGFHGTPPDHHSYKWVWIDEAELAKVQ